MTVDVTGAVPGIPVCDAPVEPGIVELPYPEGVIVVIRVVVVVVLKFSVDVKL